ncbi:hypothetical protein C8J56DRAFT_1164588 [Mycena floridula]|nr:hypothetical protein C8J56DRAFT_1164588 [Mycena floridula]
MSAGNIHKISQIKVINNAVFNANMRLVTGIGNAYPMSPKVEGHETIIFDLNKVHGLNNGDTFQVKAITDVGAYVLDQTQLTYDKDSQNQGVYVITGPPNSPQIRFSNLAPIE